MELFASLGVNQTILIQFVIFVITFTILYSLMVRPYFAAYMDREGRTVGQTELAERMLTEASELQQQFESKARSINEQYKVIYDQSRSEAMRAYDEKVVAARARAKEIIDQAKAKISAEISGAKSELNKEVPEVAKTVMSKLVGKELSL